MSRASSAAGKVFPSPIAPTLRRLAAKLRSGGDAAALLTALERALHEFPGFEHMHLEPAGEKAAFESARLALPLVGDAGPLGLMRIDAGDAGEFSTGQLQLANAVADVAAVVIEHALRARGQSTSLDLLAVALDELALGVLCFDEGGALLFANAAARALLGGKIPAQWIDVWNQLAPAARRVPGRPFVRRDGSRLIHATARKLATTGPAAVVLADLAPRVGAFGETLAGEVYRSLVERSRLTLGVLAGPEGSPAAL
jgi:PAS domain-containing protein